MTTNTTITFAGYNASNPPASEEFRVASFCYKGKKDNDGVVQPAEHKNSYCLVAPISKEEVTAKAEKLLPHLISFLEVEQDKLIKAIHISGVAEFESELVGLNQIVLALETSKSSGRLNGEAIEAWFKDNMEEALTLLVADKQGYSDELSEKEADHLESVVSFYGKQFSKLASGRVSYSEDAANSLKAALVKTDAVSTVLGAQFSARFDKMIADSKALETSFLDI